VLTKAELDIRASTQPRYHLELALLRWIHLRRLVPLSELIEGLDRGGGSGPRAAAPVRPAAAPPRATAPAPAAPAPSAPRATSPGSPAGRPGPSAAPSSRPSPAPPPVSAAPPAGNASGQALKDALMSEIQKTKKLFFGTVVAQAQRIAVDGDTVTLTFGPQHRIFRQQLEQNRPWLEELASRLAGRRITVAGADGDGPPAAKGAEPARAQAAAGDADRQSELKQKAMADSGVQAMLDVFGTDIKDVKEI
jgi:DNA polymerase-3 subunit gamma/tau